MMVLVQEALEVKSISKLNNLQVVKEGDVIATEIIIKQRLHGVKTKT